MRNLFLAFLISFYSPSFKESFSRSGAPVGQGEKSETAAPLSPDLMEASQLSQSVATLYKEGKYNEALPLAKRALELREKALPGSHALIDAAISNLAELYMAKREYASARDLYKRLLEMREEKIGLDNPNLAPILNKLAFLFDVEGEDSEAERAYRRALFLWERGFGPNSVEAAESLYKLAEFYRFQNDFANAEPLYERSLMIRGQLSGWNHPDVINVREKYECLLYEHNRTDKLQQLAERLREKLSKPKDSKPTIEGGVLNGKAISLPRPNYPAEARKAHIAGLVIIKVLIDEYGQVYEASNMCGGHPYLTEAALRAARQARFTSTKQTSGSAGESERHYYV